MITKADPVLEKDLGFIRSAYIVPNLRTLFSPCPVILLSNTVCRGTIDTESGDKLQSCGSCGQVWDLMGKPVMAW